MGITLLKIAAVYLIVGMSLGVFMGMTQNFALHPVHAHLNLLGWASLGLAGLLFHHFPALERSRLAKPFFWLYNLSVPGAMLGLTWLLNGHAEIGPYLGIFEIGIWLSGLLLVLNILLNLGSARPDSA